MFNIMEEPLDLADFKTGTPLKYSRCLHKGIITSNYVILIGGSDLRQIEVLTKKDRVPQANVQNCFFEEFYNQIVTVNFNEFCLKKCALA